MGSIIIWLALLLLLCVAVIFTSWTAGLAVLFCLLLLPLISWGFMFLVRGKIAVSIQMPATGEKDADIEGRLIVRNNSILPIGRASVVIGIRNDLTEEYTRLKLFTSALPRGQAETAFKLSSAHCGYIRVWTERVHIKDILGILPVPCSTRGEGKLTVLPSTFPMELSIALTLSSPEDSETYIPNKKGSDYSEIFQLREYVEGDSIKHIHWKLTSKVDKLIVRDASLPVTKSLLVFWDKSAGRAPEAKEADAMAEVVSSLCVALCEMKIPFHLGWNDNKNQTCLIESLEDTERVHQCIPQLIKTGHGGAEQSGAAQYIQVYGAPVYSRVIYIAGGIPAEIRDFEQDTTLTALICGTNSENADRADITFPPDNYMEMMQMLELGV